VQATPSAPPLAPSPRVSAPETRRALGLAGGLEEGEERGASGRGSGIGATGGGGNGSEGASSYEVDGSLPATWLSSSGLQGSYDTYVFTQLGQLDWACKLLPAHHNHVPAWSMDRLLLLLGFKLYFPQIPTDEVSSFFFFFFSFFLFFFFFFFFFFFQQYVQQATKCSGLASDDERGLGSGESC